MESGWLSRVDAAVLAKVNRQSSQIRPVYSICALASCIVFLFFWNKLLVKPISQVYFKHAIYSVSLLLDDISTVCQQGKHIQQWFLHNITHTPVEYS